MCFRALALKERRINEGGNGLNAVGSSQNITKTEA